MIEINCLVQIDSREQWHNTDWYGFYQSFERGLPDVKRRRALLLGAGGAGVAVAHAALKLGIARLDIFDRDDARARALADELNKRWGNGRVGQERTFAIGDPAQGMSQADGQINATPIGMISYPGMAIAADLLQSRHWVADIVYMPLVTELLRTTAENNAAPCLVAA